VPEPLKNHFGADVPAAIAAMVSAVHPTFPVKAFVRDSLDGYDALGLTGRGWHLARTLRQHLPADYAKAVAILVDSAAQPVHRPVAGGMASFLFMPHCCFVAEFGLDHFRESMQAQHVLTQRFTCEFSVRPYLIHHAAATLKQLKTWAGDPNDRVRRLVSEGTRPRLPWATRLPAFQAEPKPVLELLEMLKDDPSLYVRRSVANNLNDIGKDNPQVLADTAARWLKGATPKRAWIVRHALRWAVKQGDPAALAALGFGKAAQVEIANVSITPQRAQIGGTVSIGFDLRNPLSKAQDLMVDLAVHYVKSNGKTSAKVFKLKALNLAGGETAQLQKKLSLTQMTTRTHFPGRHALSAQVNGQPFDLAQFELILE
jgi:3-methyladenine DNA glycosylase AlkC